MGLQECIRTVSAEKNTNGCKGYLQSNPLFNPSFYYNADAEGNEFASAEVGSTIVAAMSERICIFIPNHTIKW